MTDIPIQPNVAYTLEQTCQILKVSDATLRRWLKAHKIKAARVGRAYRILGAHIMGALDSDDA